MGRIRIPRALEGAWPLRPALGAFAFGAGLWLLGEALSASARAPQASAQPVAAWATDRDGHAVIGLDRELFVAARIGMRYPIEVEARSDGGAWVVSAPDGDPLGGHRLTRLSASGAVLAEADLGIFLDLAASDGGRALVVELVPGAASRVLQIDDNGAARAIDALAEASCVAGRAQEVCVGTGQGLAALYDTSAAPVLVQRTQLGGILADVAPGPLEHTWWALDSAGACRLMLLGANLEPLWSVNLGMHAQHLIPSEGVGEERVWIADTTEPLARRYGPQGALEVESSALALSGLDRGAAWKEGGVLLAAPGAILRLDGQGHPAPGQGGFDFLVDVDRVR
jgi:hypothetical protein